MVGEYKFYNLRYAINTVLIVSREKKNSVRTTDIALNVRARKDLSMNKNETEVMVVFKKKKELHSCKIRVNDVILKVVDKFKYLGTTLMSGGRCLMEITKTKTQDKCSKR